MTNSNEKYLNLVRLSSDAHKRLKGLADDVGMRIGDYAGTMLERAITMIPYSRSGESKKHPALEILDLHQELYMNDKIIDYVYKMGALYVKNPTEKNAELLQRACELAEIDMDTVTSKAEGDPFTALINEFKASSKLNDCIIWLARLLQEHEQLYSTDVYASGETHGFNTRMIKASKDEINKKAPDLGYRIDSERMGNKWTYKLVQLKDEYEKLEEGIEEKILKPAILDQED